MKARAALSRRRVSGCPILPLLPILLLLISLCPTVYARDSEPTCQVEYTQGRLAINAAHVALRELTRRIQEETGIQFVVGKELGEEIVSVQITSSPAVECLKRALGRFNYALVVGSDNSITRVVVVGKRDAPADRADGNKGAALPQGFRREEAEDPASAHAVMVLEPHSGEEMSVTYSTETMVVEPPLEEMVVTFARTRMIVEQEPTDHSVMVVTYPAGVPPTGKGN